LATVVVAFGSPPPDVILFEVYVADSSPEHRASDEVTATGFTLAPPIKVELSIPRLLLLLLF